MNSVNIEKLEITLRMIQIVTVFVSGSYFGAIYAVYNYNIYVALVYLLPAIGVLFANRSVKKYVKRHEAETGRLIKVQFCIICGQPNHYDSEFCKYCGVQLQS